MVESILIPTEWPANGPKPISLQGSSYRHFISEADFARRAKDLKSKTPAQQANNTGVAEKVSTARKEDRSRDGVTEYVTWLNSTIRLMAAKHSATFTRNAEQEMHSRSAGDKPEYDTLPLFPSEADEANIALLHSLPGVNLTLPTSGDGAVFTLLSARASSFERIVTGMMQVRKQSAIASVDSLNKLTTLHPPLAAPAQQRSYMVQRRYQVATIINRLFGESRSLTSSNRKANRTTSVSLDNKSAPISLPSDLVSVAYVSSASLASTPAVFSGRSLSLLQQKFAAEEAEMDPDVSGVTNNGLAGSNAASQAPVHPHYDYRIMHGQALRSRAKDIFANPVPSTSQAWCTRHRVQQCTICTSASKLKPEYLVLAGKRRESLASLIPDFLILSAALFLDLAQDHVGPTPRLPTTESAKGKEREQEDTRAFCASPAWYRLLAALATQACLNGYLTEGWTGIEPIDVLLGVGCGGWDGRQWNQRRVVIAQNGEGNKSRSSSGQSTPYDSTSSDEEEEEEEKRSSAGVQLVEAAQALFSVRSAAQAEFEREMRERKHEFLDIPESTTLADHLSSLSIKYSMSSFEVLACQFFQAVESMLGQPSLVATYTKGQTASSPMVEARRFSISNPLAMSGFMTRFYQEQKDSLVESMSESCGSRQSSHKRKPSIEASSADNQRMKLH